MAAQPAEKLSKGVQLVRAGPSSDFHDLEVGLDSHTPGLKTAPGHKNELLRLNSLRKVITSGEFWESLPLMSKVFLLASCTDALLVIAFAIQQMASVCFLLRVYQAPLTSRLANSLAVLRKHTTLCHVPCSKQKESFYTSVWSCW